MSKKQIIFYKSKVLEPIYKHLKSIGSDMTKEQIDKEIKENAGFVGSTKEATTDEMQNLIIWGFVYGDQFDLNLDYPSDSLDEQINFNWNLE